MARLRREHPDRLGQTEGEVSTPTFGALDIEVTVDDRKAYTRPFTFTVHQILMLDTELLEFVCLENERDQPHLIGK